MNTARGLVDPRSYVPSRRSTRIGAGVPRVSAARTILDRLLASMSRRRRAKMVQPLTLVLWSSSIEGIAASHQGGVADT